MKNKLNGTIRKAIYLSIIVTTILLVACKKESPIILPTGAYLWYKNANGENLLNSNLPNSINTTDIDVFVLRNGIKVQIMRNSKSSPENFSVFVSPTKGNLLDFYLDTEDGSLSNNKVSMFIRYKDGTEDKITGEFSERSKNNLALSKYWVNDNLKWQTNTGELTPGVIEIIK